MTKYAFSASFLVVTLCLAVMVALAVGAIPFAGAAAPVVSIQQILHETLVRPLGKPLATGIVLFVGLWPSFWFFGKARLARRAAGPATDDGAEGSDGDTAEAEPAEAAPLERSAVTALDRIAARHRPAEQETDLEEDFSEPDPSPDDGDGPDDDDQPEDEADLEVEDDAVGEDEPTLDSDSEAEPADEAIDDVWEDAGSTEGDELHQSALPSDGEEQDTGGVAEDDTHSDPVAEDDWPQSDDEPFPTGDVEPSLEPHHELPPQEIEERDASVPVGEPCDLLLKKRTPARGDTGSQASGFASLARVIPGAIEDDPEDEYEEDAAPMERPDWLDAQERQAIVLRQQVPPPGSPGHSFYGGVPLVPQSFEWPFAQFKGERRPLHFLMQVDLGRIPSEAGLGLLPESGVLYAFLDLEQGQPSGYRIIHAETSGETLREAEIPEELGPVYGGEARYSWPWIDPEIGAEADMPRLLPLWFFEPALATLPEPSPMEREGGTGPRWWPDCDAVADELARVQGEEVTPDESKPVDEDGRLLRPYAAFPHDWRAIAITSAQVLAELRRPEFVEACKRRALDEGEIRQMRSRWTNEAEECLAWARSHDAFARVSPEESDMFWEWLCSLEGINYLVAGRAAKHAIEATLSASPVANDMFEDDALDLVRDRHALAVLTDEGLAVPCPNRMLAPPSYVQGELEDIAAKEVLLLEVAADEAIGQLFGEGVYQFTIDPDDLLAKRFDKVRLTLSAC